MRIKSLIGGIIYLAAVALSGCGGGGGGGAAVTPQQPTTTLSGMASKGPIQAGTVRAFAVSFGAVDTSSPLAQGQTDASGNFSLDIGQYKGPVVVEVTGGSFTDEVSGATVNLTVPMRAAFSSPSTGKKTVAVTPMTELAFRQAKGSGSLTDDSISSANAGVAATFGLSDIVSTLPIPGGSGPGEKKYAAACGAYSQMLNKSKNQGESLDDALGRVLTHMGDEQEQSGHLSADSVTKLNTAITEFNASGSNATGGTMDPLPMPPSGLLRLSTAGTASIIGGIDMTINLPAGISVDADPITGEVTSGIVSISGVAAVGTKNMVVAKYTPASVGTPAQVHLVMTNVLGFGLGEFASIQFDLATGASFPTADAFTVTNFFAKGLDGAGLSGITAAPSSVEGI